MNPRYFRAYAESLDGRVGVCFYKVVDDTVTHQLWEFGGDLYWATPSGAKSTEHEFTDQPEWLGGEGAIDLVEVSAEEFERAWTAAGGRAT